MPIPSTAMPQYVWLEIFSKKINVRDLESHVANDCPLTIIDFEYKCVGCDKKVLRKDMDAHLDENIAQHLSLQAAEQQKVANTIKLSDQRIIFHHMKLLTDGIILVCENTASHMLLTTDVLAEHAKKRKGKYADFEVYALQVLSIILIVLAILVGYATQENSHIKER